MLIFEIVENLFGSVQNVDIINGYTIFYKFEWVGIDLVILLWFLRIKVLLWWTHLCISCLDHRYIQDAPCYTLILILKRLNTFALILILLEIRLP